MPTNEIVTLLEKGCRAWRSGNDMEGVGYFQRACLEWLDQLDGTAETSIAGLIPPLFVDLMKRLQAQDTIGATDVMEWEIIPLLRSLD